MKKQIQNKEKRIAFYIIKQAPKFSSDSVVSTFFALQVVITFV